MGLVAVFSNADHTSVGRLAHRLLFHYALFTLSFDRGSIGPDNGGAIVGERVFISGIVGNVGVDSNIDMGVIVEAGVCLPGYLHRGVPVLAGK